MQFTDDPDKAFGTYDGFELIERPDGDLQYKNPG